MAHEPTVRERRVIHVAPEVTTWTPAQILALVIGIAYVVLGGVALLRTGVGVDVFDPTTEVAGMAYTPLLGMIEIVFGILLIAVGAFPRAAQAVVFLGVLALAFGLLLVIEPAAFQDSIAAGRTHGWFYVATGALLTIVGLATPYLMRRSARGYVEDYDQVEVRRGSRPTHAPVADGDHERAEERTPAGGFTSRSGSTTGETGDTRRIDLSEDEQTRTTRMRR